MSEPTTTEDPALGDEVAAAPDPVGLAEPDMEPDMEPVMEPDMDPEGVMEPDMEPVGEAEASEAEAEPEADLDDSQHGVRP